MWEQFLLFINPKFLESYFVFYQYLPKTLCKLEIIVIFLIWEQFFIICLFYVVTASILGMTNGYW